MEVSEGNERWKRRSCFNYDIIAAVYDIVFFSINPNPIDKYFIYNCLELSTINRSLLHLLRIPWNNLDPANSAAKNSTYYGLQGYLATILSAEENQIAAEQTGGTGWIGASDQIVEGEWNWVTDPKLELISGMEILPKCSRWHAVTGIIILRNPTNKEMKIMPHY